MADVARSAAFYDAALGVLGIRRLMQFPENDGADAVGYGVEYPVFWIDRFHPHCVKNHTAFAPEAAPRSMPSMRPPIKAGGVDNGLPGLSGTAQGHQPGYYAAFVLDPDGNNIEAVFRSG